MFALSTSLRDLPVRRREMLALSGMAVLGSRFATGRSASAQETAAPAGPLLVHTTVPPNAEPRLDDLVSSWVTPVPNFYVRSHAPTPQIDAGEYRLSISGLVEKPLTLSVEELTSKFPKASVMATLCCAGNRRTEMARIKPIKGVPWGAGALGNAQWTGVRLADVLAAAGIRPEAKFVWFEGLDPHESSGETIIFGGSIPIERVTDDPTGQATVLLATHMNDQPLTPDHGAPLRAVVPGYIGARSVKWLGQIIVSDRPSDNHYVQGAYKLVAENTPEEWAAAEPILTLPLQSAICTPAVNAQVPVGMLTVRGYVLPPGDQNAPVQTVEVSADGGRYWTAARIVSPLSPYCWQLWDARLPVTAQTTALIVRATDAQGRMQPREQVWNPKGYMHNSWQEVPIHVG